ncbi:MAG TPA: FG-GAP-like repeat-containing protein [Planctomycetota bacterium]|nr:FG-GAP-like repeat-containing protein [Planctomycetota bacterium]
MVDYDGDGLEDLLVGTFGDSYGNGKGGRILVFRNTGKRGAPEFGKPDVLVVPSAKDGRGPVRPDTGLYADLADYDGDGDLDLIVGGYSHWTPEQRELTADEEKRVAQLRAEMKKVNDDQSALTRQMSEAAKGLEPEAATRKRAQFLQERQAEFQSLSKRRTEVQKELDKLVAAPQRVSFVWIYENTSGKKAVKTARRDG